MPLQAAWKHHQGGSVSTACIVIRACNAARVPYVTLHAVVHAPGAAPRRLTGPSAAVLSRGTPPEASAPPGNPRLRRPSASEVSQTDGKQVRREERCTGALPRALHVGDPITSTLAPVLMDALCHTCAPRNARAANAADSVRASLTCAAVRTRSRFGRRQGRRGGVVAPVACACSGAASGVVLHRTKCG